MNVGRSITRVAAVACAAAAACTLVAGVASAGAAKSGASGAAKIVHFDVPETVDCQGKTSTTVTVRYEVSKAKKQQLVVDGRRLGGTSKSAASVDAPVHCDP